MWELEDWKDFSKMLANASEAALALCGVYVLIGWLSKKRD
jgi:hypothetical protein